MSLIDAEFPRHPPARGVRWPPIQRQTRVFKKALSLRAVSDSRCRPGERRQFRLIIFSVLCCDDFPYFERRADRKNGTAQKANHGTSQRAATASVTWPDELHRILSGGYAVCGDRSYERAKKPDKRPHNYTKSIKLVLGE